MAAINLKKKLGPLPLWGWAVAGAGTLGVIFYLHRNGSAALASPTSDPALAAENAALPGTLGDPGGGGGVSAPTPDPTGVSGFTTTDDLSYQLAGIAQQLEDQMSRGVVDQTPPPAQPAIGSLPLVVASKGPTGKKAATLLQSAGASIKGAATPTATGKGVAGLTIMAQLQDLQAGLITKNQLGPNARKQLAAVHGNVTQAIVQRKTPLNAAAGKPISRATVKPVKF